MKPTFIKKLMTRTTAVCLSAVMLLGTAAGAGAVAQQRTLSGDTVTRISNPNGKPGEADGLIGDREIGYGWSMAERGDWLYIGGWRNTVGAVIKAYLEPAVLASGQMDSETMWKLVDAITNAEVPYPANENSGVLVKMNRQDPGEFQVVAETQNPFRHVAKYGNDLYFATYVGASGNDPKIYKLDENDVLTEVYTTKQGSSMRANCIYRDKLYFAGTQADEKLGEGETVKLAVIERNEAGDGWNTVADYRDFAYTTETGAQGNYGDDSFVAATAGSPFWDMTAYHDEIYATIPNMLGYVVFKGHPAKDGEQANEYGWVWQEVIGRDQSSPNNQGLSPTDKLGFTDAEHYTLGYLSVVGALGVFDDKLYTYDIDHTIAAELMGIQGMLRMVTSPESTDFADYLEPLIATTRHAQTLSVMDPDTGRFSEVKGFTALTKGTTNEYIWKHGEYNGEFYIGTMDSKVIYNYLTRLTGGSVAEMTPEEIKNQFVNTFSFWAKLIKNEVSKQEIDEYAEEMANEQTMPDADDKIIIDTQANIKKFIEHIKNMDEHQRLAVLALAYLTSRNVLNEETEAVCNNLTAMMNALRTLDVTDRDAVAAFREQYKATAMSTVTAISHIAQDIKSRPTAYCLRKGEAEMLADILKDAAETVKTLFLDDFSYELAKHDDIWKAFGLYMEISARVAVDTQGFDIYKSADGENWKAVTTDGFGDKFNYGALRFVTTEEGMYITTANPFYGTQLYLLTNGEDDPKQGCVYGDVNMDGKVNILDATMIQKAAAELLKLNFRQALLADINGDGRLSVANATVIQKYLADLTDDTGRCGKNS